MQFIDRFLNNITMYRLLLYYLVVLLGFAVVFSFFGFLPFNPLMLILSVVVLLIFGWVANTIFSKVFGAVTNLESVYITVLILALVMSPITSVDDLVFYGWAAVLSMASKFIFATHKKHIFNPVAISVAITALTLNLSASWWVSNLPMLPIVLIGGLLITRKIKRFSLVISCCITALVTIFSFTIYKGTDILITLKEALAYSPLLFFTLVMLTEPLTTPPTKKLQIFYGAFVGFLFAPQLHIGPIYSTPELALVIGNIFSYIVSPKAKLVISLKEKVQLSPDIFDFIFQLPGEKTLNFIPGQYLEWTLASAKPDTRGSRRYFTIASSPTEPDIRIGVKFNPEPSSFKKTLQDIKIGDQIMIGQLAGEFTLPSDQSQKLVFIAGGIGVTPFRSMIKYLIDNKQRRTITLFYAVKNEADLVYKDVFEQARSELGIDVHYVVGILDATKIQSLVPDIHERVFYLSGPHAMVEAFQKVLKEIKVKQIKTDYFPGF